jgi:hypothetical protein
LKTYTPDGYEVKLKNYSSKEELIFPVLINAKLPRHHQAANLFSIKWGWLPGVPHSVVLLGLDWQGKLIVADPSIGFDKWEIQALDVLWNGTGFTLDPIGQ